MVCKAQFFLLIVKHFLFLTIKLLSPSANVLEHFAFFNSKSFIADCLDNGKNKKALQEADKLLKKQKDFLCAKVFLLIV